MTLCQSKEVNVINDTTVMDGHLVKHPTLFGQKKKKGRVKVFAQVTHEDTDCRYT